MRLTTYVKQVGGLVGLFFFSPSPFSPPEFAFLEAHLYGLENESPTLVSEELSTHFTL